jgi:hypothetical protein
MANVTIEIPDILRDDFIHAVSGIQDKYYVMQASESNPEAKQKHLERFMEVTNILDVLENGSN